jgi:MATE family multidrug resistance protein
LRHAPCFINPVIHCGVILTKFEKLFFHSKKTMRLGYPLVAAQLLQMSMGFVDAVMAGQLNAQALAAIAVGASILSPIMVLVFGTLMVINPIVAQLMGAGKRDHIGGYLWQIFWLSQMLALPFWLLVRHSEGVLILFNIQPEIIPITVGYLKAISWGFPGAYAYFALRYFNEGLAVTKPSMYIALIAFVANILGNYAFMYGYWGFPQLGAVGTGVSSAIVWWLMGGLMAMFTFRKTSRVDFKIAENFRAPIWNLQKEILHIGLPNGVNICIEVSMFAIAALIIGSMGVNVVAAHQITINFASLTFMVPLGLSLATTARVGFAVGKNDLSEARDIGFMGVALCGLVMTLTALIMLTLPEWIVKLYTKDLAVQELAIKLLFYAAIFQISDGLQVGGLGALRGLKDTRVPTLINVVAYWLVGLPIGYLLGVQQRLGAEGLWMGLILGLTVAALLHNLRFHWLTKNFVTERFAAVRSVRKARVGEEQSHNF